MKHLLGLLLGLLLFVGWTPSGMCATAADGQQANLGLFIRDLEAFDIRGNTFRASFWIWTIESNPDLDFLGSLDFPNATEIKRYNVVSEETPQGLWQHQKITGQFHHRWNLAHFPFDKQVLHIDFEETVPEISSILMDYRGSTVDSSLEIPGWKVEALRVGSGRRKYNTRFGDPRADQGVANTHSRAFAEIVLRRANFGVIWHLVLGALAAALLVMASYVLHVDNNSCLSPRFGVLAGSVFAVIINVRSERAEYGWHAYSTLPDQISMAVLVYASLGLLTASLTYIHFLRFQDAAAVRRIDYRVCGLTTLVLLGAVSSFVAKAWIGS